MGFARRPEEFAGATAREGLPFDRSGYSLLYYTLYEQEFDEQTRSWRPIASSDLPKGVLRPWQPRLLGYDAAVYQDSVYGVGCSPLACNSLAESLPINRWCLYDRLEDLRDLLTDHGFERCEPGPYRLFGVHALDPFPPADPFPAQPG